MVRARRSLRRALDDLNEGIRCLLGPGDARPALVDELLGGRRDGGPARVVRLQRRAAPRRAPPKLRLVRVD